MTTGKNSYKEEHKMAGKQKVFDGSGTRQIMTESIVTVIGENTFTGIQGLVMATDSDGEPEDGLVAVFFDRHVDSFHFNQAVRYLWDGEKPTPEKYHTCPRVVHFLPEELRVESEYSIETRAKQLFRNMFHSTAQLNFPLVPNTHLCQLKDCINGALASKKSLLNCWGTVHEVYTCGECHERCHGAYMDIFEVKEPLPGAPCKKTAHC